MHRFGAVRHVQVGVVHARCGWTAGRGRPRMHSSRQRGALLLRRRMKYMMIAFLVSLRRKRRCQQQGEREC